MGKNTIDRIKREVDLVAEIRKRGIDLKQQGQDLVGLCPFHQEATVSKKVIQESA